MTHRFVACPDCGRITEVTDDVLHLHGCKRRLRITKDGQFMEAVARASYVEDRPKALQDEFLRRISREYDPPFQRDDYRPLFRRRA